MKSIYPVCKRASIGKRRHLKRNNGNRILKNLESPGRRYYLCRANGRGSIYIPVVSTEIHVQP